MNIKNTRKILIFAAPILLLLMGFAVFHPSGFPISAPKNVTTGAVAQANAQPASQPLMLTDQQSEYPLGLHLDILEDPTGQLTIADVTSPVNSALFTASQVMVPIFGYTDSAIWVRFSLDNESLQTTEYLLEVGFPNTQYIDFYLPLPSGEGFAVKHSGALLPVSSRDVVYPDFIFNVNIPFRDLHTYYLRIKSEASMTVSLTLWTKNGFIDQSGQHFIFNWLTLGGLFGLLIYHVFLSIRLKEASYIYFVILLASMLIFLLDYTGYLVVYIFPALYRFKYHIVPLSLASLYIAIILFSDAFLDLHPSHPNLHRVSISLTAAWGLFIVINPFVSYLTLTSLATPLQFISLGAIWAIGIFMWRKETRSAAFLMFAWLGMAASLFLLLLVRTGIVPSTSFAENIFQLGFLLMAVSWSVALADRINHLKAETDQTNRELRTSENKLSQILEGLPLGIIVYGSNQKPTYFNQRTREILTDAQTGVQPDIDAGRSIEQAIDYFSMMVAGSDQKYPIEKHPVFRAAHGERSSVDDIEIAQGRNRLPLEIWANPVINDVGKIDTVVTAIQDITQRKKTEAELIQHRLHLEELVKTRTMELDKVNQQLSMRLEWLSVVIKLQQMVKGVSSLGTASVEMCTKIHELLKPAAVFILRWDEKRDHPESNYCSPQAAYTPDLELLNASFEKGSHLRQEIESGKTITWSGEKGDSLPDTLTDWCQEHDITLSIMAPMLIGQSFFGVLGVLATEASPEFNLEQIDLIERMALDLASLYQDAVLLDQTLALVTLDERNRLARDLHDSVTQVLFTATLLTEVMPQIWRRDPEQGFQTLEKLRRLTRGALAEMRTMLIELRPSAVINTPLSELLSQLTEAITSRSGVPFQLFIEQVPLLPDDVQMNFYRIAQEALNNVVKHAQAMHVSVSLNETQLQIGPDGSAGRRIRLVIQDDGVGFYSTDPQSGHLGIGIMRERAEAIQAILILESEPGHGTLVSLTWSSVPDQENHNE